MTKTEAQRRAADNGHRTTLMPTHWLSDGQSFRCAYCGKGYTISLGLISGPVLTEPCPEPTAGPGEPSVTGDAE